MTVKAVANAVWTPELLSAYVAIITAAVKTAAAAPAEKAPAE
tara:strand:- start:312 stop:437 length:126 start_codon:yes stop_codon:yes gene_type:complete